jgi:hypothetical protein
MKLKQTRLAGWLAGMVLLPCAALAQVPGTGAPTGINAAFMKLFGTHTAFSARVDTVVIDKAQQEAMRMPMGFAALDNKVRLDINLEQTTSKELPAGTITALKAAGMDRIVSIFRPDQKTTLILYPNSKRYTAIPLGKGEAEALQAGLTVERETLGKETIDGHPCTKAKVVVRNQQGPVLRAITWSAADLQDLPIRIQTQGKDSDVVMHFKQVQLTKPEASQFEVPAGYTLAK